MVHKRVSLSEEWLTRLPPQLVVGLRNHIDVCAPNYQQGSSLRACVLQANELYVVFSVRGQAGKAKTSVLAHDSETYMWADEVLNLQVQEPSDAELEVGYYLVGSIHTFASLLKGNSTPSLSPHPQLL